MDREHEFMTRGMADELAEDLLNGSAWRDWNANVALVADTVYELAAAVEEGRLADWWNSR